MQQQTNKQTNNTGMGTAPLSTVSALRSRRGGSSVPGTVAEASPLGTGGLRKLGYHTAGMQKPANPGLVVQAQQDACSDARAKVQGRALGPMMDITTDCSSLRGCRGNLRAALSCMS